MQCEGCRAPLFRGRETGKTNYYHLFFENILAVLMRDTDGAQTLPFTALHTGARAGSGH